MITRVLKGLVSIAFFTWEVNLSQRKLPSKEKLKAFLDRVADYAQFQEELGEKKGNLHYQGQLQKHRWINSK